MPPTPAALPSNFFGPLYPTEDHVRLVEIFGIGLSDRVLDIGGGHNPFSRADVIIDAEFEGTAHRDGQTIRQDLRHKFIKADVCGRLPFEDKSFDFVFCSHVLEHVPDPEAACNEIMRVGKRGYIETPRKWMEFFAGHPSHQWLVDVNGAELAFEKRRFIESPYMNCALLAAWRNEDLLEQGMGRFRNISCVQFPWEGSFRVTVAGKDSADYDYSNPRHAARAHFHVARNALIMEAPAEMGLVHAETAARLCPDVDLFRVLLAAYALLLGRKDLWLQSSDLLVQRGILNQTDLLMVGLGLKKRVLRRLMALLRPQEGFDSK